MGKKILDSKILYAFLAIVIAIFLWFYVMSIDGNVMPNTIHNLCRPGSAGGKGADGSGGRPDG